MKNKKQFLLPIFAILMTVFGTAYIFQAPSKEVIVAFYNIENLFDIEDDPNINDEELDREWNKKSKVYVDGPDKKGNNLRYTLLRYMASKGLRKDSAGIVSLSPQDIANIECGNTNYKRTCTLFLL